MYLHYILPKAKIESQNLFSNRRGHGAQFAYKNYKESWLKQIKFANLNPKSLDKFRKEKRRKTVIIFSFRANFLDNGNLIGGCKPILDVLVDLGVLVDDSLEWLEDHYYQVKVPREEEKTEIFIF